MAWGVRCYPLAPAAVLVVWGEVAMSLAAVVYVMLDADVPVAVALVFVFHFPGRSPINRSTFRRIRIHMSCETVRSQPQQTQGSVGSGFVIPEVSKKVKGKGKRAGATANDDAGSEVAAATATGGVGKVASSAAGADGGSVVGGTAGGGGSGRYEKKARPPAKYLNSPETTLFKKGKNVFGLDLAKEVLYCCMMHRWQFLRRRRRCCWWWW